MSLVVCATMGTPVSGQCGLPDVRVQQTQIIVNLRRGGDGRARVHAGTALLDGDGRRKALDVIHVRLLHLVEELPRVSGEDLDVFALALGVNRVKRERRLARPAQAGDDDQLVARDFEREIFEIMLPRAADADEIPCSCNPNFANQIIGKRRKTPDMREGKKWIDNNPSPRISWGWIKIPQVRTASTVACLSP